jgi:hypothetical protein
MINRKEFLKRSSAVALGSLLLSGELSKAFYKKKIQDRVTTVYFL